MLRGASPVRAIAEFLLVLTGLKGARRTSKTATGCRSSCCRSSSLLSAAALTVEPIFAVLFLAYLCSRRACWCSFSCGGRSAVRPAAHRLEEEPFVEPSLFRSIAATTVVLFVSTLVIFVVFPRVGAGYFAAPFAGGQVLTGFSEEVGLGQLSRHSSRTTPWRCESRSIVRSCCRAPLRGAELPSITSTGGNWRRRPQELQPLVRPEAGAIHVLGSGAAPLAGTPRSDPRAAGLRPCCSSPGVRSRSAAASARCAIDGIGNLRVIRPTGVRIRYQVLASLGPRRTPPSAETLALPPIDPRIVELAREQVKGAGSASARADALLGYFRHGFDYTLEPGDYGGEDPLVRFLFETRSGFCEHFASAYAVMLRAVGIPSLVVNGYAGGEWNPYGNYFVIRQSDAHSWVEAYVDGAWRTYDPDAARGAARGEPAEANRGGDRRARDALVPLRDQLHARGPGGGGALAARCLTPHLGAAVAGLVELADEPRRRARR